MHVFLTGVGGFVGRRLAGHLLRAGDRVTGTYLGAAPELAAEEAGIELHPLDILEPPAVAAALAAAAPDVVVHLAGLSHVGESWGRIAEYFQANVQGTENILRAAAAAGRRPVVLASSSEVYGVVEESRQPLRETMPLQPGTPYALTKAAAELLGIRAGATIVRSFNLVGPGQSPRFALPAFAAQLAAIAAGRQEPRLKVGNLAARRDFVHVDDACEAYRVVALAAAAGELRGEVLNLASGEARSIGEALARLVAIAGVSARVDPDPARMRPLDLPLLRGDAARLHGLGWRPRRGLDQALRDLWAEAVANEAAGRTAAAPELGAPSLPAGPATPTPPAGS